MAIGELRRRFDELKVNEYFVWPMERAPGGGAADGKGGDGGPGKANSSPSIIMLIFERTGDAEFAVVVCNEGIGVQYHPYGGSTDPLGHPVCFYRTAMRLPGIPRDRMCDPAVAWMLLQQTRVVKKDMVVAGDGVPLAQKHQAQVLYEIVLPHLTGCTVPVAAARSDLQGDLTPVEAILTDSLVNTEALLGGGNVKSEALMKDPVAKTIACCIQYLIKRRGNTAREREGGIAALRLAVRCAYLDSVERDLSLLCAHVAQGRAAKTIEGKEGMERKEGKEGEALQKQEQRAGAVASASAAAAAAAGEFFDSDQHIVRRCCANVARLAASLCQSPPSGDTDGTEENDGEGGNTGVQWSLSVSAATRLEAQIRNIARLTDEMPRAVADVSVMPSLEPPVTLLTVRGKRPCFRERREPAMEYEIGEGTVRVLCISCVSYTYVYLIPLYRLYECRCSPIIRRGNWSVCMCYLRLSLSVHQLARSVINPSGSQAWCACGGRRGTTSVKTGNMGEMAPGGGGPSHYSCHRLVGTLSATVERWTGLLDPQKTVSARHPTTVLATYSPRRCCVDSPSIVFYRQRRLSPSSLGN